MKDLFEYWKDDRQFFLSAKRGSRHWRRIELPDEWTMVHKCTAGEIPMFHRNPRCRPQTRQMNVSHANHLINRNIWAAAAVKRLRLHSTCCVSSNCSIPLSSRRYGFKLPRKRVGTQIQCCLEFTASQRKQETFCNAVRSKPTGVQKLGNFTMTAREANKTLTTCDLPPSSLPRAMLKIFDSARHRWWVEVSVLWPTGVVSSTGTSAAFLKMWLHKFESFTRAKPIPR